MAVGFIADSSPRQQAFGMAEAGIEVAKARVAEDPDLDAWTSDELRLEGVGEGSVVVTIERQDAEEPRLVALSTGEYGGATRKIEATFAVADGEPTLLTWRETYE